MKILLLYLILFKYAPAMALEPIVLTIGEKKMISSHKNIWIEDSSTLTAEETSSGFILSGQRKGKTRYRLGSETFEAQITTLDQQDTYRTLLPTVKKTLSLNLQWQNGEVVVSGKLVRFQDWQALYEACLHQNCDYRFQAEIKESLRETFEKNLNEILKSIGVSPQRLFWGKEISVQVPQQFLYKNKLKAFGLVIDENPQSLDIVPVVKVNIVVAEIHREKSLKYGIQWPTAATAQLAPVSFDQNLSLTANFLETEGLGQVLASPSLICKSGKEAEFLAGGEIPIRVSAHKSTSVVWKKYGVSLKVQPQADASGKISLAIETEVSSIDMAHAINGIPAIHTNKVQSHFNLNRPQTIVLSGLLKEDSGKSQEGLIGLQHLPILGALFSSRDYRENRTELIILVRPEILQNE